MALFVDVQYWMVDYRQGVDLDAMGVTRRRAKFLDFNPLRAEIGLEGLVTRRLALTLRVAIAIAITRLAHHFQDQSLASIDYRFEPRLQQAGYTFKVGDDAFSNFYTLQRANIKTTVNLPARLSISGRWV